MTQNQNPEHQEDFFNDRGGMDPLVINTSGQKIPATYANEEARLGHEPHLTPELNEKHTQHIDEFREKLADGDKEAVRAYKLGRRLANKAIKLSRRGYTSHPFRTGHRALLAPARSKEHLSTHEVTVATNAALADKGRDMKVAITLKEGDYSIDDSETPLTPYVDIEYVNGTRASGKKYDQFEGIGPFTD